MTSTWTEELDVIEVLGRGGAPVLTVRRTVTPVNRHAFHGAISLRGELCAATTPVVEDAADRLVRLGVVDMSFDLVDLRLCTSDGVDFWFDLGARLALGGGDVRLRNASGAVRRVLDVCGLAHASAA